MKTLLQQPTVQPTVTLGNLRKPKENICFETKNLRKPKENACFLRKTLLQQPTVQSVTSFREIPLYGLTAERIGIAK